jgi:hypothetical protein
MANQNDIRLWLERGKEERATHVIVACDTFEYEDYPVYVHSAEQATKEVARLDGHNMQKVMEVYDLALDLESQLRERIAWHLEKT